MPDRAPLTTYILAALAAILWGASFNLAKPVLAELQPLVAGADRYLIAAAIMLAITCIKGEPPPLRHFKAYLVLGLMGVFGFNLFFFLGMASTTPVNGALIMALNPLLTSLIARFRPITPTASPAPCRRDTHPRTCAPDSAPRAQRRRH
jgi:drug/metabolite transporter (DMT)-like permease